MYKLMVVEDEPLIRMGLKKYFEWEELGFHEIVEAENGSEGVDIALRERPDLIITDIRMPLMDGLEMIERLRKELPDTLFVIWTGYNEFAYAQRAIRLGNVFAYLLKPLQYAESIKTIHDCIEKLDLRREQQISALSIRKDLKDNMKLKRSQFVKQLIEDGNISTEIDVLSELCGINAEECSLQPFVLSYVPSSFPSPQSRTWWWQNAERILINVLHSYLGKGSDQQPLFTYQHHSKLYAFTVCGVDGEDKIATPILEECIQQQLTLVLQNEGAAPDVHLYVAVGQVTSDIQTLPSLLLQSDKALFQRFIPSGHQVFEIQPIAAEPVKGAAIPFSENDKIKLQSFLEQGDVQQLQQFMNRLAIDSQSKVQQLSLEQWLSFIQEIIAVAIRFAGKHGINMEERYHEKLIYLSFLDDFDSITALFEWITAWMIQLGIDSGESLRNIGTTDTAMFEQIEAYILQHIDQEITLQMVADRFFYNPSYLSRLFKAKLNKNYMTFVTEIRMEYAKRCLLQSNYAMTDVCLMCGYTSYKHFVKTFKKFTNMAPTEYRKQMGMMD
ncbi:response regulator [Paenibacillus pini]